MDLDGSAEKKKGNQMEAAWALIFAMTAGFGALSWAFCRTGLASRIAERIGFGDEPAWKE